MRPAKEDKKKDVLWNPSWGLWREAAATLWGGVRQLDTSFKLDEELALFCPPGTQRPLIVTVTSLSWRGRPPGQTLAVLAYLPWADAQ